MPQVDLVSACAGGDNNKIGCETDGHHEEDFPPESFWLSKDAEFDWFDRNAFYERTESHKGVNNNPSTNLNPNPTSTSQRFVKSKPSIIGLPKPQKNTCFIDVKNRKPGTIRLFPKRTGSINKSTASGVEPSSPKVSCMGRVRSKRDRKKRSVNRQKKPVEPERVMEKPQRRRRTRLLDGFRSIFRSKNPKMERESGGLSVNNNSHDIMDRLPARKKSVDRETESEPVGLGGMKRFTSGRRSDTWGVGELE
ncbi:hypothetical protein CFOL_v3_10405 [Cephalotus follicularis]|uniref:Uncharacterized protein n=1 Tax=Cephalotus follicularis TaxID=3775 RepID=A0A1Q3BG39_CEPFO|nr:hypothetical protein CFOL_v3_10405 [Cephalotus follicularis]